MCLQPMTKYIDTKRYFKMKIRNAVLFFGREKKNSLAYTHAQK